MRISRIHIQAFKSLYEVGLSPSSFTVLIGPNNAGKTNLADALDFVGDVYSSNLEIAVSKKGGFDNIAHRRMRRTKHPISMKIEATMKYQEIPRLRSELRRILAGRGPDRQTTLDFPDLDKTWNPEISITHSFSLGASSTAARTDFTVKKETFSMEAHDKDEVVPLWGFQRDGTAIVPQVSNVGRRDPRWRPVFTATASIREEEFSLALEPTQLVLTTLPLLNQVIRNFSQSLGRTQVYQFSAIECRRPGVPAPNPQVDRHGANLPAVVSFMERAYPREWKQTLTAMQAIVPGLEDIRTDYISRKLSLLFQEAGVGRPWTADEVSDGTIQALALFLALHDRRTPLTVIEEPENSVHPWILRNFVDSCRGRGEKQVILTTHSPALISYLSPDEATIVWRSAGRTHAVPLLQLDPNFQRMWVDGEVDVFELVDSGWLPEAVPEGYS